MADREIGGQSYSCQPLPAVQGLSLLTRVLQVLGPAAGMLESALRNGADAEIFRELARFMAGADKKEIEALVLDLAALCKQGDAKAEPATLNELLRLAVFALEVQFGSFFEESLAGSILRGMGKASA